MKMKYLHDQPVKMEEPSCIVKHDRHDFVSLLDEFRLKELYCDATIACEGKKYPVHQVVLSACSDFFAEIFASESCQNPLVLLQDVSSSHLENLLSYVYTGEVHIPHKDLPDFLKAAKSLFVKGLMIPNIERYADSDSISGTWHEPCQIPGSTRTRLYNNATQLQMDSHRHFHCPVRVPHTGEARNHQYRHHHHPLLYPQVPYSGIKPANHHRRDLVDHARFMAHEAHILRQHKQIPSMADYPQDLRVSPPRNSQETHVPVSANNDLSHDLHGTKDESLNASGCSDEEMQTEDSSPRERKRMKSEDDNDLQTDLSMPVDKFIASESQGTFKDLIFVDDLSIKEEPEDVCDAKEYTEISTNVVTDPDEEEEEDTPLHISEDQEDPNLEETVADSQDTKSTESKDNSQNHYAQFPEDFSRSLEASSPPQGSISPNSQLRRELLRPIPKTSPQGHMQQQYQNPKIPTTVPMSIPHPVIATREPQVKHQLELREPPPLLKLQTSIPTLVEGHTGNRDSAFKAVKSMSGNRANSHLLVTAPPTYRSHAFSFEIHNQQLGPVLVNGGSHIAQGSPSSFTSLRVHQNSTDSYILNNNYNNNNNNNDVKKNVLNYDCDAPLNLSGPQNFFAKSPECSSSNEDPCLGKIVTNRKKRLRGPKSWEFLVRLLKDPTTNPNLIRWENESHGIFRLVQPAVIAQRWGRRTGKHASENLSYENFARGLRYHYATGALKPVSEKSFVYRFGPKALKTLQEDFLPTCLV